MKYQVVEKLYEIEKNNGELFQVNKIKWKNNSFRYDLRLWKEDIPMQGITFTANELKDFCRDILLNQGISAISMADDEDFTTSIDLSDIDLKILLKQSTGSIKPSAKIRALMKDLYPGKTREVNILYFALESGITKKISDLIVVSESDIHRFSNLMESLYGIKKIYSLWAIQMWADAYGVNCHTEPILEKWKNSNPAQNDAKTTKSKKRGHLYKKGDVLIDNDEITVIYKGITGYWHFMFEVHNNSNKALKLELAGLDVNDFEVRYYSLHIDVSAGKRTISEQLCAVTDSIRSIGVKDLSDVVSLQIKLIYTYGENRSNNYEFSLVPVKI